MSSITTIDGEVIEFSCKDCAYYFKEGRETCRSCRWEFPNYDEDDDESDEEEESPETNLIDILMTRLKNETDPTIINMICNQLNEIPNTDTCECCDNKRPLINDDGVWCCQECIDNPLSYMPIHPTAKIIKNLKNRVMKEMVLIVYGSEDNLPLGYMPSLLLLCAEGI